MVPRAVTDSCLKMVISSGLRILIGKTICSAECSRGHVLVLTRTLPSESSNIEFEAIHMHQRVINVP
jgi:hypothetical protein